MKYQDISCPPPRFVTEFDLTCGLGGASSTDIEASLRDARELNAATGGEEGASWMFGAGRGARDCSHGMYERRGSPKQRTKGMWMHDKLRCAISSLQIHVTGTLAFPSPCSSPNPANTHDATSQAVHKSTQPFIHNSRPQPGASSPLGRLTPPGS